MVLVNLLLPMVTVTVARNLSLMRFGKVPKNKYKAVCYSIPEENFRSENVTTPFSLNIVLWFSSSELLRLILCEG